MLLQLLEIGSENIKNNFLPALNNQPTPKPLQGGEHAYR
jgi:hypothetical protein